MTSPVVSNDLVTRLRTVRAGILLSLLTILAGFALGGVFGAAEDTLKGGLAASAEAVRETVYAGDASKMKDVVDKSWNYYKRAHLHAGAIGTATLAASVLLAALGAPAALRAIVAAGLGIGGLGYGLFWLLAGQRAPALGSTGAAKASLEWLAVPSSGLLIGGLVVTILLVARELYGRSTAHS
jgi:hypothetical protein